MKNKAGILVGAGVLAAILVAVFLARDGGGSNDLPPRPPPSVIPPETTGTLEGEIRFEGQVPASPLIDVSGNAECHALHGGKRIPAGDLLVQDGRVQNAFAYIRDGLEKFVFAVPAEAVVVDNIGCMYAPRVAGAQVGQPIRFTNSDPTLHNIHGTPKVAGGFNFALSGKGTEEIRRITKPEVMIPMKCDLHPWMKGFLGVVDHPFYKVTGPDGRFAFEGVPAGSYTVEVWHERLGRRTETVTVEPGKSSTVTVTLRSP